MQIIPVIDLLNGIVVRGVAGRRAEYRPVVSQLTNSCDAIAVAFAFRKHFGLSRLYIADLDAILHQRPNTRVYSDLTAAGFQLWVDGGFRDMDAALQARDAGAEKVIAGLETWPGPSELQSLCQALGSSRVIFSLDLQSGVPTGNVGAWQTSEPFEIGSLAANHGIREMIVLDIAQVGVGEGVKTKSLCRRLKQRFHDLTLMTGGGVRSAKDLESLENAGIDAVLIASALHDGRLKCDELARWKGL